MTTGRINQISSTCKIESVICSFSLNCIFAIVGFAETSTWCQYGSFPHCSPCTVSNIRSLTTESLNFFNAQCSFDQIHLRVSKASQRSAFNFCGLCFHISECKIVTLDCVKSIFLFLDRGSGTKEKDSLFQPMQATPAIQGSPLSRTLLCPLVHAYGFSERLLKNLRYGSSSLLCRVFPHRFSNTAMDHSTPLTHIHDFHGTSVTLKRDFTTLQWAHLTHISLPMHHSVRFRRFPKNRFFQGRGLPPLKYRHSASVTSAYPLGGSTFTVWHSYGKKIFFVPMTKIRAISHTNSATGLPRTQQSTSLTTTTTEGFI